MANNEVMTMAAAMAAEKAGGGHKNKIYKVQADEHKAEILSADIQNRLEALREKRDKVNLLDLAEVEARTLEYLEACSLASVFPSVMGLSVQGFGMSRQALNQWLLKNPGSQTAEYIFKVKDIMADILVNASLNNNANSLQALFQLKNHFEHTDKAELQFSQADNNPLGPCQDEETLRKKYMDSVSIVLED